MYAVTSVPLDRRTRATFRRAEFGFLGVMVFTCRHTPRFCGQPCRAGCFGLRYCCRRALRTSWLIVGMLVPKSNRTHRTYRSYGTRTPTLTTGTPEKVYLIP